MIGINSDIATSDVQHLRSARATQPAGVANDVNRWHPVKPVTPTCHRYEPECLASTSGVSPVRPHQPAVGPSAYRRRLGTII